MVLFKLLDSSSRLLSARIFFVSLYSATDVTCCKLAKLISAIFYFISSTILSLSIYIYSFYLSLSRHSCLSSTSLICKSLRFYFRNSISWNLFTGLGFSSSCFLISAAFLSCYLKHIYLSKNMNLFSLSSDFCAYWRLWSSRISVTPKLTHFSI